MCVCVHFQFSTHHWLVHRWWSTLKITYIYRYTVRFDLRVKNKTYYGRVFELKLLFYLIALVFFVRCHYMD